MGKTAAARGVAGREAGRGESLRRLVGKAAAARGVEDREEGPGSAGPGPLHCVASAARRAIAASHAAIPYQGKHKKINK